MRHPQMPNRVLGGLDALSQVATQHDALALLGEPGAGWPISEPGMIRLTPD